MNFYDWGCLNHLEQIEVTLQAGDIPLGALVRKPTGTKTFILGATLTLYTENGVKKEIKVDDTARILLSPGTFVHSAIGVDKNLVWIADTDDLVRALGETPQ